MDFGGESRRYLGEEHPRKRACLYSSFHFRGARSYLGQATLNLSKGEYKKNERKEQQQKAAEERAKRAKERRNIEQQEVEVAVKRKHLNRSSDRVADIHFNETSTCTSTGEVEEYTRNLSVGSNSPGAFPPVL